MIQVRCGRTWLISINDEVSVIAEKNFFRRRFIPAALPKGLAGWSGHRDGIAGKPAQYSSLAKGVTVLQVHSPAVHEQAVEDEAGHAHGLGWTEFAQIAVVAAAAAAVWLHFWEPFPHVSLIGVCGLVIGGWPIFSEAAENIAARRMTMELSMSIAIIAAAAISEFFTALVITLFVLVAEVLEDMTVSRGRRAIS